MKPDIRKIRQILGDELFYSAHEYIRMGNVKSISLYENRITADVQGEDIFPYDVDIEISSDNLPVSAMCSCNSRGMCIHIASALLCAAQKIPKKKRLSPGEHQKGSQNKEEALKVIEIEPEAVLEISQGKNKIKYSLFFMYGTRRIDPEMADDPVFEQTREISSKKNHAYRRNRNFEARIIAFVNSLLKDISCNEPDVLMTGSADFISRNNQKLKSERIRLKLRGSKKTVSIQNGNIAFRAKPLSSGFNISSFFIQGDEEAALKILPEYLDSNLVLVNNRFCQVNRRQIRMLKKLTEHGMESDGCYFLSRYDLNTAEIIQDRVIEPDSAFTSLLETLKSFRSHEIQKNISLPDSFKAALRPYQLQGYNWMSFLDRHNLCGCLADDMGLGKTVQTLAFIQKLSEEGRLRTSLLIVPVITISNWLEEIHRFAPQTEYLVYRGENRTDFRHRLNEYDLVITSYHTFRIDADIFMSQNFRYVIIDEAQNIKNPDSKARALLMKIKSEGRLALTGTPFENSMLDLWSLMDFLNPGIVGTRQAFTEKYINAKSTDSKKLKDELRAKISPFILRRKKSEVLTELPPREDILLWCEMEDEQRSAYDALRIELRDKILSSGKSDAYSSGMVFQSILKLRQMALFPVLASDEFAGIPSCKLDMFDMITEKIVSEENRMLVFSQFVRVLKLLKENLDSKTVGSSYIDGSTRKRDDEISAFKNSETSHIFLLSLKAAGVGINLTEADYVLLFDPWWNPAVENQAIDRAHRIGRKEKITAYRMIVKDSIEEKILRINERKSELAEDLITSGNEIPAIFDRKTILSLFE